MGKAFRIEIPKPCHEDWDAMTPNENGRFCDSCAKTVVDFTNMQTAEIQRYFIDNHGTRTCGMFKNSQLEKLTIQIPEIALYSQTSYRKIFLLALFVSMGTVLFSCADENGNRQKIDKVEVTDNNSAFGRTVGEVPIADSLSRVLLPPPKTDQKKIIQPCTKGDVAIEEDSAKYSFGVTRATIDSAAFGKLREQ